jgi:hypothetical protein
MSPSFLSSKTNYLYNNFMVLLESPLTISHYVYHWITASGWQDPRLSVYQAKLFYLNVFDLFVRAVTPRALLLVLQYTTHLHNSMFHVLFQRNIEIISLSNTYAYFLIYTCTNSAIIYFISGKRERNEMLISSLVLREETALSKVTTSSIGSAQTSS